MFQSRKFILNVCLLFAPGITHNCSPSTAVLNMIFLAISLGSLQAEQVAAGWLKNKMDKENIQKGEVFLLSTGGNKLQVQVGCSHNKSKRKSVNQISLQLVKGCYGNASKQKHLNTETNPKVSLGQFPSFFKNYRKSLKN